MKFKFFHDNAVMQDAITTSHIRYTILELRTIIWIQNYQFYTASFHKNSSTNVFYISALLVWDIFKLLHNVCEYNTTVGCVPICNKHYQVP
jgi:peptide subunit release factor RF-3